MLSKLLSTGGSAGYPRDLVLLVALDLLDDVALVPHVQDAKPFERAQDLPHPLLVELQQDLELRRGDVDQPPLIRQSKQVRERTPHILGLDPQARVPPQVDVQLHPLLH